MSKELTPVDKIKNWMASETVKQQFQNALNENANLFQASVIELVSNDKYLAKCDPKSVLSSALTLAVLKLPLNKSLGFAYLVPYKGVCQPQIGYKGLIQLAQRTGLYQCINAGPVYSGELKSVDKLSGIIDLSGTKTSDEVVGYFAYFKTNYGFEKCVYWTVDEVKNHASRFSESYKRKSGPWWTDFPSMATKTLLKHVISHYGPMTIDIGDAISRADGEDTPSNAFDLELTTESPKADPKAIIPPKEDQTAGDTFGIKAEDEYNEDVADAEYGEKEKPLEEKISDKIKADLAIENPQRIKELESQFGDMMSWGDPIWSLVKEDFNDAI